jgi:hydrogenase maturation protein HypF
MDRLAKIAIEKQDADPSRRVRLKISIGGIVQGVGFRPFIYRLARKHNLTGYVLNNPEGVEIEAEGRLDNVSAFLPSIVQERPPRARIDTISAYFQDNLHDDRFVIKDSDRSTGRTVLVSPDIATCPDCLRELRSAGDRRCRYPFINCTNCGPRYTIIADIPYDRVNTTMHAFRLCPDCQKEYLDPLDRRFHAEPNACWICGPRVDLKDESGASVNCADPIESAISALHRGMVVAVKGLGGFHLAVDAMNENAVRLLRSRKHREEKPLAIMARDIEAVMSFAVVSDKEEEILLRTERPIVLLRKRAGSAIADSVAPGNRRLGVMLPYTPLHHLLLDGGFTALVMTSANISEEPIAIDIADAKARLGGIVDLYLDHNREILSRCDDSVVRVHDGEMLFLRRSRGWVPLPRTIELSPPAILACGGHLKNTIALSRRNQVFLSQHVGDLENLPAFEFFKATVDHLERILEVRPEVVAHDMHPDYLSTRFAMDLAIPRKVGVQHHHAHIASCLGEVGIDGPVIGFALDGTGYGPDGTIWGCEALIATRASYERVGHLAQVAMPGGEAAVREPWRMALSHLDRALDGDLDRIDLEAIIKRDPREISIVRSMLSKGINSPLTSSCGRLFDAVASMCDLRHEVSYEGQAAIELEMTASLDDVEPYTVDIGDEGGVLVIRTEPLVAAILTEIEEGRGIATISARFHSWVAHSLLDVAIRLRAEHGIGTVALSGGCFQNEILLRLAVTLLRNHGFTVLANRLVPTNDGGVSFGQVIVAAARIGSSQ